MAKKTKGSTGKPQPISISSEAVPRRTLKDSLRLAVVLHEVYAGKNCSADELASALQLKATSAHFKYLLWAALAYGLLKREGPKQYGLAEVGRKIVAPTYDGEDAEGKLKAILTPTLLGKFYTDYNNHPLPNATLLSNVIETRFGVPRDRVAEVLAIILDNAAYVGIIQSDQSTGQQIIKLPPPGSTPDLTTSETDAAIVGEPEGELEGVPENLEVAQVDWQKTCFVITPIGDEGSPERQHADMMLKHLVEPVVKPVIPLVIRADKIERGGIITQQILDHLTRCKLCVADLSFSNPNVFYELAIRHMMRLPTIQFIRRGDRIPFDVQVGRTIILDTSNVYTIMDRFEAGRRELTEYVKAVVENGGKNYVEKNPVTVYLPKLTVHLPK